MVKNSVGFPGFGGLKSSYYQFVTMHGMIGVYLLALFLGGFEIY